MPPALPRALRSWLSGRPTAPPLRRGPRIWISPASSRSWRASSKPPSRSPCTRSPASRSRHSCSTYSPGRTARRWWTSLRGEGSRSAPGAQHEESHAEPHKGGGDDPRALGRDRPEAPADAACGVVDLEGILGHQSDGAGDPARAFLFALDGVVVVGQLWSGHPRIMGRSGKGTGNHPDRAAPARRQIGRVLDVAKAKPHGPGRTYSGVVIRTVGRL